MTACSKLHGHSENQIHSIEAQCHEYSHSVGYFQDNFGH